MATHAPQPSPIEASLIKPPRYDLYYQQDIQFLHPGYRRPINTFLTLSRVDTENSNGTIVYGVHHKTALTACQIIAGNIFHTGYFASDDASLHSENVSLDGLLTKNFYYFIVEGNDKYPIVPSFKDWQFPHEELLNLWPAVYMRDMAAAGTCSVTSVSYAINRVHLVPQEEARWYNMNGMSVYGGDIDYAYNILSLGKSLHTCFDDGWFAIVPKLTTSGMQFVTHILSQNAAEIWPTYHNSIIQVLSPASTRPYLFARFAWAIFLRVRLFVTQGYLCQVIRVHVDEEEGVVEYKQELMSRIQLQELYGDGSSTSAALISGDESDDSDVNEVEAVW